MHKFDSTKPREANELFRNTVSYTLLYGRALGL